MSYVLRNSYGLDYLVARRVLDEEEDTVTLIPVYLVVSAPEGVDEKDIKDVIERSGENDNQHWNWREYKVVSENNWTDGRWEVEPEVWVQEIYWSNIEPFPSAPWVNATTYDELVERIGDERRVTLRLPLGLHVALSRAAKDMTLNSFCIKTLAEAVSYKELEEFEAQRRKPGRPKKLKNTQ